MPQRHGAGLASDPAITAALDAFRLNTQSGLENSAALAGLGNSGAVQTSLARAQADLLSPLFMQGLDREERGIDRLYGATESELSRRERSNVRQAEATQSGIDRLLGLSGQRTGRQQSAIGALMSGGATSRGVQQDAADARFNDFLRRQALSEQGLYSAFGGTLPSAFGSKSITNK